jgi:anti-sigma-K factor RskA
MIAVAAGEPWAADEETHLAACADCAAEWRLVQAASRIGRRLPPLDPDRIAADVRARLASGEVPRTTAATRIRWRQVWLGLAAAAAVTLAVGIGLRQRGRTPPERPAALLVELDDLDSAELELVLEAVPPIIDAALPDGAVGMSDLSTTELERVLGSWEG